MDSIAASPSTATTLSPDKASQELYEGRLTPAAGLVTSPGPLSVGEQKMASALVTEGASKGTKAKIYRFPFGNFDRYNVCLKICVDKIARGLCVTLFAYTRNSCNVSGEMGWKVGR